MQKTKKRSTSYKKFNELIKAIEKKETTKVYFLLQEGINIDATNENGRTPLMAAITEDDLDLVRIIVEAGADLELQARDKETALLYACRVSRNCDIIDYLIESGADKNARNQYKDNALVIAAEYNPNWEICEYLIKKQKYDVNDQEDIYHYTPLMAAARFNNIDVVNVLIANGANLYAQDKEKWLPIFHAAAHQNDNPMNLIRLLGMEPEQFFYKVGRYTLKKVAKENNNRKIYETLNTFRNIYLFCRKKQEERLLTSMSLN